MILAPDKVIPAVTELITSLDYYRPQHGIVHDALIDMHAAQEKIDVGLVVAHLDRAKTLQQAGGHLAIFQLAADVHMPEHGPAHAEVVLENAKRRAAYDAGTKLRQAGTQGSTLDLESIWDIAYETIDAAAARYGTPTTASTTSWAPLDLEPVLHGQEIDPPPTILTRTDGQHLLYDGAVHSISGEPGSGKTWTALLAALQLVTTNNDVAMLDFEDRPGRVIGRLLALGATPDQIRHHFRYIRPTIALDDPARKALTSAVKGTRLVILDGVTEAMDLHGLDLNNNNDVATFLKLLPRWIADHGPAVLMIDHVTKDKEQQGRWALGGQHKLAGIDGVAYVQTVQENFGRGRIGHARVTLSKDRPGHVSAFMVGRTVAELWLDASQSDVLLHGELRPPSEMPVDESGNMRPTRLMEKVSRYIEANPNASRNNIVEAKFGKKAYVVRAIDRLIQEGWIEVVVGARNTHITVYVDGLERAHVRRDANDGDLDQLRVFDLATVRAARQQKRALARDAHAGYLAALDRAAESLRLGILRLASSAIIDGQRGGYVELDGRRLSIPGLLRRAGIPVPEGSHPHATLLAELDDRDLEYRPLARDRQPRDRSGGRSLAL
jgi:hypothetical protein